MPSITKYFSTQRLSWRLNKKTKPARVVITFTVLFLSTAFSGAALTENSELIKNNTTSATNREAKSLTAAPLVGPPLNALELYRLTDQLYQTHRRLPTQQDLLQQSRKISIPEERLKAANLYQVELIVFKDMHASDVPEGENSDTSKEQFEKLLKLTYPDNTIALSNVDEKSAALSINELQGAESDKWQQLHAELVSLNEHFPELLLALNQSFNPVEEPSLDDPKEQQAHIATVNKDQSEQAVETVETPTLNETSDASETMLEQQESTQETQPIEQAIYYELNLYKPIKNESLFLMNEVKKKFRWRSRYRTLVHSSWIQPMQTEPVTVTRTPLNNNVSDKVSVSGGEQMGNQFELMGSIQFSQRRFLHADLNLWLNQLAPKPNTAIKKWYEANREQTWTSLPDSLDIREIEELDLSTLLAAIRKLPAVIVTQSEKQENPEYDGTDASTENGLHGRSGHVEANEVGLASEEKPLISDELHSRFQQLLKSEAYQKLKTAYEEVDDYTVVNELATISEPLESAESQRYISTKSYKIDQTRKITSNQLHYFDHPKFGAIVAVRKINRENIESFVD